jgi:hypothetical protein
LEEAVGGEEVIGGELRFFTPGVVVVRDEQCRIISRVHSTRLTELKHLFIDNSRAS